MKRLAPLIREYARHGDQARQQHPEVIDAFVREGLFRLWVPQSIGGSELDLIASLELFEGLSSVDGSAGWTATIGAGGGLFAAYMERVAAKEVFGPPEACIAGSGTPSGMARQVEGGFEAQGTWRYASGAHHATWFTANCVLQAGDDEPKRGATPTIRAMAFPADQVEILDTWDVWGMRGTDSHDFRVRPVRVASTHTFSVFTDSPQELGPLYRFPFVSIAEASFGAVALGVGRHVLDAFVELAREKRSRTAGDFLAEQAAARIRLAEGEAMLRAARELFFRAAREAWEATTAGEEPGRDLQTRVTLAAVHAAATAAKAATLVHQAAGMSSVFMASELGRAWRDANVLTQHAMLSPLLMEATGDRIFNPGR